MIHSDLGKGELNLQSSQGDEQESMSAWEKTLDADIIEIKPKDQNKIQVLQSVQLQDIGSAEREKFIYQNRSFC